jgi:hypothetical protein
VQKGKQIKKSRKGKGKKVGLFHLLSRVLNLPILPWCSSMEEINGFEILSFCVCQNML